MVCHRPRSATVTKLEALVAKRKSTIAAGHDRLQKLTSDLEKAKKKASAASASADGGSPKTGSDEADLPAFGVGDLVKVRQADNSVVEGRVQYFGKTSFYEGLIAMFLLLQLPICSHCEIWTS